MVRGWQSRVEKAGARRVESKQRKQRQNLRSTYKTMFQSLVAFLEKHAKMIGRRADPTWTLQLWTDSIPCDGAPLFDKDKVEDAKLGSKRRGRGNALGEELQKNENGQPPLSCDIAGSATKKIIHPRSKTVDDAVTVEEIIAPVLCRSNFFTGKCDNHKGGKKGCYKFVHYPKRSKTLAEALKASKKNDTITVQQMLETFEKSFLNAMQEDWAEIHEAGGMEMLYYTSIDLAKDPPINTNDNNELPTAHEILSKSMVEKSIAASNVVYVAINDILIFDRFQNGIIISDQDMVTAVLGVEERWSMSSTAISSERTELCQGNELGNPQLLPGQILEYIMTYLPDQCVTTISTVCHAWNNEIKSSSPELWRHMLQRRGWPIASNIEDAMELQEQLKSDFCLHYTVVRDMEDVKDSLDSLFGSGKKGARSEITFQAFSKRRTAPQEPNRCIAVEVWSANQILTAYKHDCTLRLFKALDRSTCRELICICVNPFRKTKKQRTTLLAMALDDTHISSLCRIQAGIALSYILIIITREDFLTSDGNCHNDVLGSVDLEEGAQKVIDLREAVLNYLVSLEDLQEQVPQLSEYLAEGGELKNVEVLVGPSLVACGFGRFLVEVSISIQDYDDDDTLRDTEYIRRILFGKHLALICGTRCIVIWMSNSLPRAGTLIDIDTWVGIACSKSNCGISSCAPCIIATTSPSSYAFMYTVLEGTGNVQPTQTIYSAQPFWSGFLEGEAIHLASKRPMVITENYVVVASSLTQDELHQSVSFVSFYSRISEDFSHQAIQLDGNCEVLAMQQLRDHYLVITCYIRSAISETSDVEQRNYYQFQALKNDLFAILLHVPTRKEIHRVCLVNSATLDETLDLCPFYLAAKGDTVGVGVLWKGVAMAGSDVRRLTAAGNFEDSSLITTKLKAKKHNRKKGNTKVGFAHGRPK